MERQRDRDISAWSDDTDFLVNSNGINAFTGQKNRVKRTTEILEEIYKKGNRGLDTITYTEGYTTKAKKRAMLHYDQSKTVRIKKTPSPRVHKMQGKHHPKPMRQVQDENQQTSSTHTDERNPSESSDSKIWLSKDEMEILEGMCAQITTKLKQEKKSHEKTVLIAQKYEKLAHLVAYQLFGISRISQVKKLAKISPFSTRWNSLLVYAFLKWQYIVKGIKGSHAIGTSDKNRQIQQDLSQLDTSQKDILRVQIADYLFNQRKSNLHRYCFYLWKKFVLELKGIYAAVVDLENSRVNQILSRVLDGWYRCTCKSVEKQLYGMKMENHKSRRALSRVMVAWYNIAMKSKKRARFIHKYKTWKTQNRLFFSFYAWKQFTMLQQKEIVAPSLENSKPGMYFPFKAWKVATEQSDPHYIYLDLCERQLIAKYNEGLKRKIFKEWMNVCKGEGQSIQLEKYYKMQTMQKSLQRWDNAPHDPASVSVEDVDVFADGLRLQLEQNGSKLNGQGFIQDLEVIQRKQKELAMKYQHLRSSSMEIFTSMNRFVEGTKKLFEPRSLNYSDVNQSVLDGMKENLQAHLVGDQRYGSKQTTPVKGISGIFNNKKILETLNFSEMDNSLLILLKEESDMQQEKHTRQLMKLLVGRHEKNVCSQTFAAWREYVREENTFKHILSKNFRQVIFRKGLLMHRMFEKYSIGRESSLVTQYLELLFVKHFFEHWLKSVHTANIHRANVTKMECFRTRLLLARWYNIVQTNNSKRATLYKAITTTCSAHLNIRNALQTWHVDTQYRQYLRNVEKKCMQRIRTLTLGHVIHYWSFYCIKERKWRLECLQKSAILHKSMRKRILLAWTSTVQRTRHTVSVLRSLKRKEDNFVRFSFFKSWCKYCEEIKYKKSKQHLRQIIKEMGKMITKQKEEIELVESERDEVNLHDRFDFLVIKS